MCTILVRWDPTASEAIVLAANRDEFRERLADDPEAIAPGVYAGRDRRAGGTWLAVGGVGLAAITNISGTPPLPDRPSRGELPLLAVAGTLPASFEAYNSFNLLVADATGLRVIVHLVGRPTRVVELAPGAHAIVNQPFGEEASGRAARAARLVAAGIPDMAMLADHGGEESDGLCHHGPAYGTVSATVVALDRERRVVRYLHADGLPCRARPLDRSAAARAATGAALR